MFFKILLSRSVQTPNSDKNWQTSCPLQTFVCNISRHLEFITEQGHRLNWVSGSLDSRVTGSLGHKMWPSSMSDTLPAVKRWQISVASRYRSLSAARAAAGRRCCVPIDGTDRRTPYRYVDPAPLEAGGVSNRIAVIIYTFCSPKLEVQTCKFIVWK